VSQVPPGQWNPGPGPPPTRRRTAAHVRRSAPLARCGCARLAAACWLGASVISRTVTFSSLAASRSSDAAWHCCRAVPSYHTARHRSPGERAGYTVMPAAVSIATRPAVRPAGRGTPVTIAVARAAVRFPPAAALVRRCPVGAGCGFFVGILGRAAAREGMACLSSSAETQVRGLMDAWDRGAGERDRTADLPLTRRLLCHLSYTGMGAGCMVTDRGPGGGPGARSTGRRPRSAAPPGHGQPRKPITVSCAARSRPR
jgi:hypothetical protein